MKNKIFTVFALMLLVLPGVSFAEEATSTATSTIAQSLSTSTPTQADIDSARSALRQKLLDDNIPAQTVDSFLNDPRLKLDLTLMPPATSTPGKPFDYFSASYGLTSKKAVKDALTYRRDNWKWFVKARKVYGVDSYYILATLRLETYFGASKGRRDLPSSFYSLYVLNPRYQNFAASELSTFLKYSEKNGADPFSVKGSWAGAFGIPQFIPSSVSLFAADGDSDGKIDLFNDADAIMSVARYLSMNGWGKTDKTKLNAYYAYNHDMGYAKASLAFGKKMKMVVEGK